MKVLFVDDRHNEVRRQWHQSGCGAVHELLPLQSFESVEQVMKMVRIHNPDVIIIGHGLGKGFTLTGSNVIEAVRAQGFTGKIIANSGGGVQEFTQDGVEVDGTADRNAQKLRELLKE